jgi:hypothetical protein
MSIKEVTKRIFRRTYQKRLLKVDEAVSLVAPNVLGSDQIKADWYAERNKRRVWKKLVDRIDDERGKGLYPTFTIVDTDRYQVAWFPKLRESDDSSLKQKKIRLTHRGRILDHLDSVTSRDYEAIGCVVCMLSGATKWHLTDLGNEYGIDFLALLPAYGKHHLFPHACKQVRIVGQSKKWGDPIKRDQVGLLADTLNNIRYKNKDIHEKVLPHWFISAKGLLVGCMIAHSGSQSGGYERAHDHGIIMADSRDIAEIIALDQTWDIGGGPESAVEFLNQETNKVLQEYQRITDG